MPTQSRALEERSEDTLGDHHETGPRVTLPVNMGESAGGNPRSQGPYGQALGEGRKSLLRRFLREKEVAFHPGPKAPRYPRDTCLWQEISRETGGHSCRSLSLHGRWALLSSAGSWPAWARSMGFRTRCGPRSARRRPKPSSACGSNSRRSCAAMSRSRRFGSGGKNKRRNSIRSAAWWIGSRTG